MYRRRRPQRDKNTFSFDSFLDVVANVIGIIIRLILVAWVGSRSYTATMKFIEEEPPHVTGTDLPPPRAEDDPLHTRLLQTRNDLEEARRRLEAKFGLANESTRSKQTLEQELAVVHAAGKDLDQRLKDLESQLSSQGKKVQLASLSAEELRNRGQELLRQIQTVEKQPVANKKELRFRTPVSRSVEGDELFFECRGGRVCFIDLAAFLNEVQRNLEDIGDALREQNEVRRTTAPVGAFRLRYTFRRDLGLLDSPDRGYRYGMTEWVVEPVTPNRGETLEAAFAATSDFRRIADAIDPNQSVVTLWVYPDSFELFRRLRDYLYEREVEVAGRPLPFDSPIAANRTGSKSRGQ